MLRWLLSQPTGGLTVSSKLGGGHREASQKANKEGRKEPRCAVAVCLSKREIHQPEQSTPIPMLQRLACLLLVTTVSLSCI
jgi:hypothetical protein